VLPLAPVGAVAEFYLVRRQHDLVKRQGIALIAVLISAPLVSAEPIRPSILQRAANRRRAQARRQRHLKNPR
jgi:hypothetical protein